MNIKYTHKNMHGSACADYVYIRSEHTRSVESYVTLALDHDAEGNDLDRALANARETREALGRLVEILCDKGVLGLADVKTVAWFDVDEEEKDHELVK